MSRPQSFLPPEGSAGLIGFRSRFALPDTIPSTGTYSPPRQLFLLDLCDSFTASSILKKVDLTFTAVGEEAPARGMYCM